MNNQDMQFADPEWTPSSNREDSPPAPTRPINHTIEEYQESIIPAYEQDKLPAGQEYPLTKQPGKRIGRRAFTAGLLIAGAGTLGGLLWLVDRHSVAGVHLAQTAAKLPQTLQPAQGYPAPETDTGFIRTVKLVSNPPTVIVKCNGDVTITGSLPMEVDAHAIYRRPYIGNSLLSQNIRFSLNKQGNELTVTVEPPADNDGKMYLNLTVPQYALLTVQATGNIQAQNITDTVVSLTSSSGGITFSGSLTGTSTLHSAQGIQFLGGLSENGTYYMQSDKGNVELLLPDGTMFHLQAKTNGTLSNDFPPINPPPQEQAQLFITADNGDIVIKKSF